MMVNPMYGDISTVTALHLELTTRCNSGCAMCPRYVDAGGKMNPSLELTEITLEQFKEWFKPDFIKQLRRVYSCGNYGDPIIAKDMLEIYKYIRECNPNTQLAIHTNAGARTTAWWSELGKLMSHEDDYVTFSVDGLEDTNHIYRRNTDFAKIYENMKAYTSAGGIAKWDYIVFAHNEHQVEDAKRMADELGFKFFNIKKTTRWAAFDGAGRGMFHAKTLKGERYLLQQPVNPKYQDENQTEFKRALGIIPQYITNEEFNRLIPNKEVTEEISVFDSDTRQNITIKHNILGIECRAIRGRYQSYNELFISATGHVFPCCFLGGEPWRDQVYQCWNKNDTSLQMIELNGGMDSISLKHRPIQDIVISPLFSNYLPNSFEKNHAMRSQQCSACCGVEYNKLDQGELGSSYRSVMKQREKENGE